MVVLSRTFLQLFSGVSLPGFETSPPTLFFPFLLQDLDFQCLSGFPLLAPCPSTRWSFDPLYAVRDIFLRRFSQKIGFSTPPPLDTCLCLFPVLVQRFTPEMIFIFPTSVLRIISCPFAVELWQGQDQPARCSVPKSHFSGLPLPSAVFPSSLSSRAPTWSKGGLSPTKHRFREPGKPQYCRGTFSFLGSPWAPLLKSRDYPAPLTADNFPIPTQVKPQKPSQVLPNSPGERQARFRLCQLICFYLHGTVALFSHGVITDTGSLCFHPPATALTKAYNCACGSEHLF